MHKQKKRKLSVRDSGVVTPLLRQPDQPVAVLGRSPESATRAWERFRGIAERTRKMRNLQYYGKDK